MACKLKRCLFSWNLFVPLRPFGLKHMYWNEMKRQLNHNPWSISGDYLWSIPCLSHVLLYSAIQYAWSVPGLSSVPDPQICLTDPDLRIRKSELQIGYRRPISYRCLDIKHRVWILSGSFCGQWKMCCKYVISYNRLKAKIMNCILKFLWVFKKILRICLWHIPGSLYIPSVSWCIPGVSLMYP
jgi:hypothetical protein